MAELPFSASDRSATTRVRCCALRVLSSPLLVILYEIGICLSVKGDLGAMAGSVSWGCMEEQWP